MDYGFTFGRISVGFVVGMFLGIDVARAEIVAEVNGIEISSERLDERIASLPQQERQRARTPQGVHIILQQVIAEEVLYQEAKRRELDRLRSVLDRIQHARRGILVEEMAERILGGLGEAEVRKYYEDHKGEFKKVRASHILTETEQGIREAKDLLNQGMEFEVVARKLSRDPSVGKNGGDLGYFTRGTMVPQFSNAAFSMAVNELRGPVRTEFGYHLIKVVDVKEPEEFGKLTANDHQLIRRQMFQNALDELQSKANIEIFQEALAGELKRAMPTETDESGADTHHDE